MVLLRQAWRAPDPPPLIGDPVSMTVRTFVNVVASGATRLEPPPDHHPVPVSISPDRPTRKGVSTMKAYTKPVAKPVSQPDIIAVVR